jgi:hypothetical protein
MRSVEVRSFVCTGGHILAFAVCSTWVAVSISWLANSLFPGQNLNRVIKCREGRGGQQLLSLVLFRALTR